MPFAVCLRSVYVCAKNCNRNDAVIGCKIYFHLRSAQQVPALIGLPRSAHEQTDAVNTWISERQL